MTIQHSIIGNVDLHEPKGINTALSNQIYKANGLGSGVWTALQEPLNRVAINTLSDFPTSVAGVITLAADTDYILGAPLSTADRFVVSDNTQVSSTSFLHNTLTYTGSATMFTGVDVSFRTNECRFSAPTGTIFNLQHTVAATHQVNFRSIVVENCAKWGTFGNCLSVVHSNCAMLAGTDGLSLTGTNILVDIFQYGQQTAGGAGFIGIDLGTSVNTIIAIANHQVISTVAGATGISGLASNGNVPSGSIARVAISAYIGSITPLVGITVDDVRWEFRGNDGIDNTQPDAIVSLTGNATATTISASSTDGTNAVKLAGTWVVESNSHFTADTTGKITYDGEKTLASPIDVHVVIEPSTGTNKDLAIYIAKNGTTITMPGMRARIDAANPQTISTSWQDDIDNGDFYEVFAENQTDTTNVLGSNAIFRIL